MCLDIKVDVKVIKEENNSFISTIYEYFVYSATITSNVSYSNILYMFPLEIQIELSFLFLQMFHECAKRTIKQCYEKKSLQKLVACQFYKCWCHLHTLVHIFKTRTKLAMYISSVQGLVEWYLMELCKEAPPVSCSFTWNWRCVLLFWRDISNSKWEKEL